MKKTKKQKHEIVIMKNFDQWRLDSLTQTIKYLQQERRQLDAKLRRANGTKRS